MLDYVTPRMADHVEPSALSESLALMDEETRWMEDTESGEVLDWLDAYDPILDASMMLGAIGPHADELLASTHFDLGRPGVRGPSNAVVASPPPQRAGEWMEPAPCTCTRWVPNTEPGGRRWVEVSAPHQTPFRKRARHGASGEVEVDEATGEPVKGELVTPCQRCWIEFFAGGRKRRRADDDCLWEWDSEGEYGCMWMSGEVDGLRAHAVRIPHRSKRNRSVWAVVMSEFEATAAYTFTHRVTGVATSAERTQRTIIGWQACPDREEAELLAREIQEQWRVQDDHRNSQWVPTPHGEVQPSRDGGGFRLADEPVEKHIGAAVVSPEFLDVLANRPSGRTTGRLDTGE